MSVSQYFAVFDCHKCKTLPISALVTIFGPFLLCSLGFMLISDQIRSVSLSIVQLCVCTHKIFNIYSLLQYNIFITNPCPKMFNNKARIFKQGALILVYVCKNVHNYRLSWEWLNSPLGFEMGKWTNDDDGGDWDSGSWPPQPGTTAATIRQAAAAMRAAGNTAMAAPPPPLSLPVHLRSCRTGTATKCSIGEHKRHLT
jgi:hypothetical protein